MPPRVSAPSSSAARPCSKGADADPHHHQRPVDASTVGLMHETARIFVHRPHARRPKWGVSGRAGGAAGSHRRGGYDTVGLLVTVTVLVLVLVDGGGTAV